MIQRQILRSTEPRSILRDLYSAAVAASAPGPVLETALDRLVERRTADALRERVWIVAIGKAAHPMAEAAVAWLKRRRVQPVGGVIVAPEAGTPPHPSLRVAVGDHPEPGQRSFTAAARVGEVCARVREADEVWVLLSGGASSLAAAPVGSVREDELTALFGMLLGSGLDIVASNTIRKRFLRWGAGRLAVALQRARVRNFMISDVVGDNVAAIGSGPCVPDPARAANVRGRLVEAGLWDRVPIGMRRYLAMVEQDPSCETPKPGDDAFRAVERRVIASNRQALDAVVARATALGLTARVIGTALTEDAADAGRHVAASVLGYCRGGRRASSGDASAVRSCFVWGGETVVRLAGAAPDAMGGRCQELALAAARELAAAGDAAAGVSVLAAGTDGRDGPTDAAGAIVDASTWAAVSAAGRDPARDLAQHDAYRALDAARALLRTGLTGTNVLDVVIGLC